VADPLVSVVVPVYRTHIPYVEACLDSVTRQTTGSDWELVVVDDGPGAGYASRLDRLLSVVGEAGTVRYVRPASHRGPAEARNAGARESRGAYLLWLDSDDLLEPEAIEAIAPALRAGSRFVYTDEVVVSADARRVHYARDKTVYQSLLRRFWGTPFDPLLHATFVDQPRVIRKTDFFALGGFRTDFARGEEIDLELRMSERAGREGLVLVPRRLYRYRRHARSMMSQSNLRREVIATRERILAEAARRRGLDVARCVRLARASPTNAPHYALLDSRGARISVPYLDYDTLTIRPEYLEPSELRQDQPEATA
jgi:glycosyltransferase involved in cell wall biosynthesis